MPSAIKVIDIDSHVIEPPDLWTSRVHKKWGDDIPQLVPDARIGELRWRIGRELASPVGSYALAGWKDFFPSHPPTLEEADPAGWNADARLARMDEYGIHAQVLYPNLLSFSWEAFLAMPDAALRLACVQAWNDFLSDFAQADPKRLIPVTVLPFWDIEASLAEMRRCWDKGHKGVLLGTKFEHVGLPPLRDAHWSPLLDQAEEMGLSVNFHIGFAAPKAPGQSIEALRSGVDFARMAPGAMLSNADAISELTTSGICHRHPKLNFVSVESGVSWLPFLLESLDWQWLNNGCRREQPERELPSFYFKRQIHGSFWYEQAGLGTALSMFPDNVMFETDFPHPTCLAPGPASYARRAEDQLAETLAGVPEAVARKVLHDNAARVYHLD